VFNLELENSEFSENIWIEDSGASCHYCNNHLGYFDVKDFSERVNLVIEKTIDVSKIRSQKYNVVQVNGKTVQLLLHEIKFAPGL
jgi:hypothetical protein